MTANIITAFVLIGTILAVGIYDVVVIFAGPPEASVSTVVQEWGRRYPVLPMLVGLILGHLFWPINAVNKKQ